MIMMTLLEVFVVLHRVVGVVIAGVMIYAGVRLYCLVLADTLEEWRRFW